MYILETLNMLKIVAILPNIVPLKGSLSHWVLPLKSTSRIHSRKWFNMGQKVYVLKKKKGQNIKMPICRSEMECQYQMLGVIRPGRQKAQRPKVQVLQMLHSLETMTR